MVGLLTRLMRSSAARARDEGLSSRLIRLPAALSAKGRERRRLYEELVILGVLLDQVARADGSLSPREERRILEALRERGLAADEAGLVVAAAHESAKSRPDLQGFTREVNKRPYRERIEVLELLFHLAYADAGLHIAELEAIREIARLLWVSHKDLIDAKLRVREGLRGGGPAPS